MKKFIYILFFYIYSCGYPDIDSVPTFKKLSISEKESIDLCNLSNADKKQLSECLSKINK